MYLITVYYPPVVTRDGLVTGGGSELWDTAETEQEAIAKARAESLIRETYEFAVEGGQYEPGGWSNPLFKAGGRLQ